MTGPKRHAMRLIQHVDTYADAGAWWRVGCVCGWHPTEAEEARATSREDHRQLYRRHIQRSRDMVERHRQERRIEALDRRAAYRAGGDPTP